MIRVLPLVFVISTCGCGARTIDPFEASADAGLPDGNESDASSPGPVIEPVNCDAFSCEGVELFISGSGDDPMPDGSLQLWIEIGDCGSQPLPFEVPVDLRGGEGARLGQEVLIAGLQPGEMQLLRFSLSPGTWEDLRTDCVAFIIDPADSITECSEGNSALVAAFGVCDF